MARFLPYAFREPLKQYPPEKNMGLVDFDCDSFHIPKVYVVTYTSEQGKFRHYSQTTLIGVIFDDALYDMYNLESLNRCNVIKKRDL